MRDTVAEWPTTRKECAPKRLRVNVLSRPMFAPEENIRFSKHLSGPNKMGALCVQLGCTHFVRDSAQSCMDILLAARSSGRRAPTMCLVSSLHDNGYSRMKDVMLRDARACSSERGQVVPLGNLYQLDTD